jgi:hypothetical protein
MTKPGMVAHAYNPSFEFEASLGRISKILSQKQNKNETKIKGQEHRSSGRVLS